jgi:hypothetical protein
MQHTTTEHDKMTDAERADIELNRIENLTGRMHRNQDRLKELKEAAANIRNTNYCNRIQELTSLEAKTTADITAIKQTRDGLCNLISALDDERAKELLYLRYVCRMDFYKISEKMSYSLGMLHRIRKKGLTIIGSALPYEPQEGQERTL